MQLLAVSYVLPPNLYPQAIQIGRLLYNSDEKIGVVSGKVEHQSTGLDCYSDFDSKIHYKIEVPIKRRLKGWMLRFSTYFLPFVGRCPDEYRNWIDDAKKEVVKYLEKNKQKVEKIISFGEPMTDHLLGLQLKKILGVPWVAHFSDPWVDNPFRKYFFLSKWVNLWLEKKVISAADSVIFTSVETLDLVMSKYPSTWRQKAFVIPHGFEKNLYPPKKNFKNENILVLRYIGNFYSSRSPEPLFKALAMINMKDPNLLKDIKIELVGGIPKRMMKGSVLNSLPTDLIKIVPTVSYINSLKLMVESDLLIVIDAPNKQESVFLPSKLIDYLGSNTPIFGIVPPGTSSKLIERIGGQVANPDDAEAIAIKLMSTIELCKERKLAGLYDWGNQSVRNEYGIELVAKNFFEIVKQTEIN